MTTSISATPATPVVPAKPKRPITLALGAAALALLALLSFASPFLPRGGGFGGGPGMPPQGGQAPGLGQPPAQGSGQGQGFNPGQGQGQQPGQGLNQRQGLPGGSAPSFMGFLQPIRIGEGIVGGLAALMAALGLWRRQKWGMVLALVVAVAGLLAAAATFAMPLVGRSPWLMFITGSTWQAIAGAILAIAGAILVLLPVSRKAYIVRPKERRVA